MPLVANPCSFLYSRKRFESAAARHPKYFVAASISISNKVTEYNQNMAQKMGWIDNPYEYRPERGLYYHFITDDVAVGTQPLHPSDIDQLAALGIRAIHNLQQDTCMIKWNVDFHQIRHAAQQNRLAYIRTPAIDFDPNSLRATLPHAVAQLERARMLHGKTYIHCTAGLGRSPAVAIASLYWFSDMQLDEAYDHLTSIRPCGPNKDAIRGATFDILDDTRHWDEFYSLPKEAFATLSEEDKRVLRKRLLGDS